MEHPRDGRQDGLLVFWAGEPDGDAQAIWGDSWGQQGAPMSLAGRVAGQRVELDGTYAQEWGWRILVEAPAPDRLRILMFNVVPADHASDDHPAGPYLSAEMDLSPAASGSAG